MFTLIPDTRLLEYSVRTCGTIGSSQPYLAEGRTLCHDDLELALASGFLQEGLDRARVADGHDHLIGVDVLQGLHCNVISRALWNTRNTWA